jgi:methanogenic corrinoid protein MtbC1
MEIKKGKIQEIISQHKDTIAKKIVEKQYNRFPDYWKKFGEEGKKKSIRDAAYHLPFLTEAVQLEDKEIFTDYVEWVKLLFREINLPEEVMTNTLKYTSEVLKEYLSDELYTIILPYIEAGIQQMEEPVKELQSYIDPNGQYGDLAKQFNEALLKGHKNKASNMILEKVKDGAAIKDIYLHVFQVSQLETGRLWLLNKINVAKEHYVSAATQMIMSQLYPYIFATERKGLTFIGACIGGELHEIGLRMVSDFFEMDGWDTYHLGANTPVQTLLEAIDEYKADLMGLSIAMPYHQTLVKDVIEKIKKEHGNNYPKILVGGNGIKHKKEIWRFLGADGYAPDAQKAVELANNLIKE